MKWRREVRTGKPGGGTGSAGGRAGGREGEGERNWPFKGSL